MSHIIKSYSDINFNLIEVKKPYTISDNIFIFDISYDKNPFLFQTPDCVIPYSYSLYDNKTFKIDVTIKDDAFSTILLDVNKYIEAKITKYNKTILENKISIDYIKKNNTNDCRLRLKNNYVQNVLVYDKTKNQIDITNLQTFDKVVCLFQLQRLIVQKENYIFQCQVLQIKRLNTIIPQNVVYLIEDEDTSNEDDKEFNKYQSMYNLGIPLEAVKHKMTLDGLPSDVIKQWMPKKSDNKLNTGLTNLNTLSSSIVPPPIPPPLPPPLMTNNTYVNPKTSIPKANFLKDIANNNFKLKKNNVMGCVDSGKKTSNLKERYGYDAPSLKDILNARSNLKKVTQ